ncbi:SlyX family protein [Pelagibius sp. Alg239-R121]|uniref:SlyX family protein n=1 Tax=Pelagibius sp. Alg239-R121 TaxID=2993448 RepID=UPI0024A690F0|nr:SlyX family protein [Pelagibius sp. Alg239-R121]
MTQDLQDKIDRLEAHVAEQERVLQDMSEVMAKQWSNLDALTAKVNRLLDRLRVLEAESEVPDTAPPPHY